MIKDGGVGTGVPEESFVIADRPSAYCASLPVADSRSLVAVGPRAKREQA